MTGCDYCGYVVKNNEVLLNCPACGKAVEPHKAHLIALAEEREENRLLRLENAQLKNLIVEMTETGAAFAVQYANIIDVFNRLEEHYDALIAQGNKKIKEIQK